MLSNANLKLARQAGKETTFGHSKASDFHEYVGVPVSHLRLRFGVFLELWKLDAMQS